MVSLKKQQKKHCHLNNRVVLYGKEQHKYINEAVSGEMLIIVSVCNVYFSLVNLGRNLLDMDTFSKSDPGRWIVLIL